MVRVALKLGRDVVFDGAFDDVDVLAGGDASAIADPEDMGVDGLRRLAPPHVQDDIRGLASDARKGLQRGARRGHFAAIVVDQNARHFHDVLGLVAIQADGLDVFDQPLFAQVQHLLRGVGDLEKGACGLVDACVGGLRAERNRDHQRIGVDVIQFALGFGFGRAEARENLMDRVIGKLLCHSSVLADHAMSGKPRGAKSQVPGRLVVARRLDLADSKDSAMTTPDELETGYHYQLMRRAIDLIDGEGPRDLSLEQIAREMHMSPAHFQRIFSRWAGVSPKRYQQWLALDHAKKLLATRHTTLETADAVGLSGSGRLHDLFVRWEAMSPGDYARGGGGLEILWGWFESPFGPALVMGTERGICGIGFAAETGPEDTMTDMLSRWPKADFVEDPTALAPLVAEAFPDDGAEPGAPRLFLIGAPFQIKVWEALLHIPTGHVTTYSDIARLIGHPKAVRAVGTAVGRNPISWLIPCHRALRKSGGLGGYHWGLPVKRAMLAWEAAETA